MRIVGYSSLGSLSAVADVANAMTGLEILIWLEISSEVLSELAGEMITPRERRAK